MDWPPAIAVPIHHNQNHIWESMNNWSGHKVIYVYSPLHSACTLLFIVCICIALCLILAHRHFIAVHSNPPQASHCIYNHRNCNVLYENCVSELWGKATRYRTTGLPVLWSTVPLLYTLPMIIENFTMYTDSETNEGSLLYIVCAGLGVNSDIKTHNRHMLY